MKDGDIYLGIDGSYSLLPAFGRRYTVTPTILAREERTASGRLVRDIIATKNRFSLNYSLIDGTNLDILQNFYCADSTLSLRVYNDTTYNQYTVLMQPIEKERVVLGGSGGLWSGIKVILDEV